MPTGGDLDKVTDYISAATFAQHNPDIADGIDGPTAFIGGLAAEGKTLVYERTHLVIGCGNLVAALSEVDLGGVAMAVIDLFRVADGRIVEPWTWWKRSRRPTSGSTAASSEKAPRRHRRCRHDRVGPRRDLFDQIDL